MRPKAKFVVIVLGILILAWWFKSL